MAGAGGRPSRPEPDPGRPEPEPSRPELSRPELSQPEPESSRSRSRKTEQQATPKTAFFSMQILHAGRHLKSCINLNDAAHINVHDNAIVERVCHRNQGNPFVIPAQ